MEKTTILKIHDTKILSTGGIQANTVMAGKVRTKLKLLIVFFASALANALKITRDFPGNWALRATRTIKQKAFIPKLRQQ